MFRIVCMTEVIDKCTCIGILAGEAANIFEKVRATTTVVIPCTPHV